MRRAATVGVLALAWAYTAAHFLSSGIRQPIRNFTGDFLASFPSWRLSILLGRRDFYDGSLAQYWATTKFGSRHPLWHYGPVEHLVTLPLFAFGDLRSAYLAWLIANYVFLIAIVALAVTVFDSGRPKWIWWSVIAVAVLNYGPLFEALTQRTIELFELLLLFVAFALLQRHRPVASGVAIGFAAMTKFLPLIFLPYFALKRRFRLVTSSVITIALIAIAAELVLDWRYSGTIVQLRAGGMIQSVLDQSLAGMTQRLLAWSGSSLSPALLARLVIAAALALLCVLLLRVRACSSIDDLEWSTLIVAMVLLPPHNEQYYFVLLLFPYLALAARELRPGAPAHRSRRWWLAISFVLTGAPVPLSVLSRLAGTNVFSAYLALGIPFVGAAILAGVCVRAVLTECARDSGTSYAVLTG
jgi:hypothetical protein